MHISGLVKKVKKLLAPTGEVFSDGNSTWDRPEPMAVLRGPLWYGDSTTIGVADKMLVYPYVAAVRAAVTIPIASATFTFEPANKSALAIEIAETVQRHFDKEDRLKSWVPSILDMLDYGFAPHFEQWATRFTPGVEITAPVSLEPIPPRLINSVTYQDGKPISIKVDAVTTGETSENDTIPARNMFWPRWGVIGSRQWEGNPFIRPMWSPWWRAINLLNWEMVQAEHLSGGTYKSKPIGSTPFDPFGTNKDTADALLTAMQALRNGEAGGIVMPSGFDMEALNVSGAVVDLNTAIVRENESILVAGFSQVIAIGMNGEGARAAAESHLKSQANGIEFIATIMSRQITQGIIHNVVRVNWGDAAAESLTPILKIEGLTADNVEQIGKLIVEGLNSGALTYEETVEKAYRANAKLPERVVVPELPEPTIPTPEPSEPPDVPPTAMTDEYQYSGGADGRGVALSSLKAHRYSPRRYKRERNEHEMCTDFRFTDLVIDTAKVTGRDVIMGIVERGRTQRVQAIRDALNGDSTKVVNMIPRNRINQLQKELKSVAELAVGYGYNEADREIKRQEAGIETADKIDDQRQKEVAGQFSEILRGRSIKFTIPKDVRKQAVETLTQGIAARMAGWLESEYSIVFLAMQRKTEPVTDAAILKILRRRENDVANRFATQVGAASFGLGRSSFFTELTVKKPDLVKEWVRSELNDAAMCDNCEDVDGVITEQPMFDGGQNPQCESTKGAANMCRGMDIAILKGNR